METTFVCPFAQGDIPSVSGDDATEAVVVVLALVNPVGDETNSGEEGDDFAADNAGSSAVDVYSSSATAGNTSVGLGRACAIGDNFAPLPADTAAPDAPAFARRRRKILPNSLSDHDADADDDDDGEMVLFARLDKLAAGSAGVTKAITDRRSLATLTVDCGVLDRDGVRRFRIDPSTGSDMVEDNRLTGWWEVGAEKGSTELVLLEAFHDASMDFSLGSFIF